VQGETGVGTKNIIARPFDKRHFPSWGIFGSVFGLAFILVAEILNAGIYSEFGHFVPILFNLVLILAGIAFIPFMIGLGWYMDSRFYTSKLAAVVGMIYASAMVFLGIFETVYWGGYWAYWLSFLFSGMIMTGLWTIAIYLQRTVRVRRLLSLFGVLNVGLFAIFPLGAYLSVVFFLLSLPPGFLISLGPNFWWMHRMVWVLHFAIIGYMLLLAIDIQREEKETREPSVLLQQTNEWAPLTPPA
jgi:hypothetical protein